MAPGAFDPTADMHTPRIAQLNAMTTAQFFGALARLLKSNPSPACATPIPEKFARIGVRPTLHFDRGQTPPVHAFWSVKMYDAQSFFVDNPVHRHALSSWMPLRYDGDGSIDLPIQHESPGEYAVTAVSP